MTNIINDIKTRNRERILSFGESYKEIIRERIKILENKLLSMYGNKRKNKYLNKIDMNTYVRINFFLGEPI